MLSAIKQPEDGAVVVFDGIVRNQTRGRRTLYLDYTAYEPMALRQMEQLAQQALAELRHSRRVAGASAGTVADWREQRLYRSGVGASGRRLRSLPLDD